MHLAILGGLMLLAALFMRRGLTGVLETAWHRWRNREP
jgi:ABC-type branched-subunit amino acid transport system permease subunit